jgi:hypothetical protein
LSDFEFVIAHFLNRSQFSLYHENIFAEVRAGVAHLPDT